MSGRASAVVTWGFVALPLLVGASLVVGSHLAGAHGEDAAARRRWSVRVALAAAIWLALTWVVAASGILWRFDMRPPPFAVMVATVVAVGIGLAFSSLGTRLVRGLPLSALVGVQVFRFPLELVMHQAYAEGVMPVQMSYSGRNFDILTGISAGILGAALTRWRVPRWVVAAWNVAGLLLLVNVVSVAAVSTPTFAWFGREHLNTFIADTPYVWLPTILVLAAWAGHLLVFRKLREESGS